MRRLLWLVVPTVWFATTVSADEGKTAPDRPYVDTFNVPPGEFASTGRNPYFILEPGYVLSFSGSEDGKKITLVITVLDQTRLVAGVETRVVEERETAGGQLTEVSQNYFAISTRTRDVYYFGEEVDRYENGTVAGHEGSWLAGEHGNRFGLAMPGTPQIGFRYYQEIAPGIAMDRGEIVSESETLKTPAGRFEMMLKVEETSALEPGVKEYKYYAATVGMLKSVMVEGGSDQIELVSVTTE